MIAWLPSKDYDDDGDDDIVQSFDDVDKVYDDDFSDKDQEHMTHLRAERITAKEGHGVCDADKGEVSYR